MSKPQLIMLNGWNYSLERWVPNIQQLFRGYEVSCHSELVWDHQKSTKYALDLQHQYSMNPGTQLVLIGFSRGAEAALHIANHCEVVSVVYAHSPSGKQVMLRSNLNAHFYRTFGDRTPTFEGTGFWYSANKKRPMSVTTLHELPFKRLHTTSLIEYWSQWVHHQFHNILEVL